MAIWVLSIEDCKIFERALKELRDSLPYSDSYRDKVILRLNKIRAKKKQMI